MPARDAAERALIARIAAAERWGRTEDRAAATQPARDALRARYLREADPDGVLPADERARRAEHLLRAHMQRMALRAVQARRRAREYAAAADAAERDLAALGGGDAA